MTDHPTHRVQLRKTPMGLLRIYLRPNDMVPGHGHWLWGRRPIHRELVLSAKRAGLLNATVHHTHFGFANRKRIEEQGSEYINPHLTVTVEITATRAALESFCLSCASLLAGKVVVFQQIEQWHFMNEEPKD